jgi:succinyl-diaminopimelate desuccinylase
LGKESTVDFQSVSAWLKERESEMVELQVGLTARPALGPDNGGLGEWDKARFLEQYLRDHGLDRIEHYDCPDPRVPQGTRPNLAVTIPGRHDRPIIWVLCHMDIVPPGEKLPDGTWKGWESAPYTVRRSGNLLIGRGVSDNQQPIVSSVFAALAIRENGLKPEHTVKLLFVSDEETSSHYGLRYVLREHRQLFSGDDMIIVPDAGRQDSSMIEVAEKSLLWLELRVHGKQGHGSLPSTAINAFRAASQLVCLLDRELHARFDRRDDLFEPPCSTFEPTLHQGNVPNVNTIPGEDVFCFDCRVLPSYSLDEVIDVVTAQCRKVDGELGTATELARRARQDALPPTPPDAPVVKLLTAAVKQVYGITPRPMGIGGSTVAAPFRQLGLPAAVWLTTLETAHQANEACSIAHMVGDAQVFAHVFMSRF